MTMKKFLVVIAAVVVLAVGAILVLPMLVPTERIRDEIIAQVKANTGRDLSIRGRLMVSVFPSLSLQVTDVGLSNPPGFAAGDMVRLGALDLKLKLVPILSGRVEVDSFVLVDPVIKLEIDQQGRNNWTFAAATPPTQPVKTEPTATGASPLAGLQLGDVHVTNGSLLWHDARSNSQEQVSAINLAVHLPSIDTPLTAKGDLKWQGKTIDLGLDLAKPRALLDGSVSDLNLTVSADPMKVAFKGSIDNGKGAVSGDVDLGVGSVRNLVQWMTTQPLPAPSGGFGPLSVKGRLAAGNASVSFTKAAIALDTIKAAGDVSVDTSAARPAVRGRLDVETLDLTPYLPPEDKSATAKSSAGGRKDWSDEAIDATGLKALDLDFVLSVQAVKARTVQIGRSAVKMVINNGHLTADLTDLALYQGTGKGRLAVDGSAPGIGLDAAFTLTSLNAEPFLVDVAGFDRLSGTASTTLQLAGKGRSERQLVSDLGGKGQVSFVNGAIKGINLAAMVRNVTSAFSDTGGAQKTDFAELSGSWTMAKGVLTNKDLALKSPLLRVEGNGTVDLPKRSLQYRIQPKAVASLEGQGGKADLAGVMVPVIVEGPWDNLGYHPDLGAVLQGQLGQIKGKVPNIPLPATGSGKTTPTNPLPIPGTLLGR
jgi:AsmA protein